MEEGIVCKILMTCTSKSPQPADKRTATLSIPLRIENIQFWMKNENTCYSWQWTERVAKNSRLALCLPFYFYVSRGLPGLFCSFLRLLRNK